jgi:hypothetical protein
MPVMGTMNLLNNKYISLNKSDSFEWANTYGNDGFDMFRHVIETSDGGYIMCGETGISDNLYPWICKVDSEGNELWDWTMTEFDHEATSLEITNAYTEHVQQTSDGGYVITSSLVTSYNEEEYVFGSLIKLNENGEEEWLQILADGFEWTLASEKVIVIDDGFILSGHSGNPKYGDRGKAIGLIKTSLDGVIQWNQEYDYGDEWDASYSFCKTNDGGYFITGYKTIERFIDVDLVMIKTDADGNKEWDKVYGSPLYEVANTVYQTNDDGFIIGGFTDAIGSGKDDGWLMKTDSSGNILWNKAFGTKYIDYCYDFIVANDNGFILCLTLNLVGLSGDKDDIQIVKTDRDGNIEWSQMYSSTLAEIGHGICSTSDGGFIVSGCSGGSWNSNRADGLIVKYAAFENQRPSKPEIDGPAKGKPDTEYTFTASASDPDGDAISYLWDWGDGNFSGWLETSEASYTWSYKDNFEIRVMAKDSDGGESDWSDPLAFSTPRNKLRFLSFFDMLENFLNRYRNINI